MFLVTEHANAKQRQEIADDLKWARRNRPQTDGIWANSYILWMAKHGVVLREYYNR